jgi:hypothetical protein
MENEFAIILLDTADACGELFDYLDTESGGGPDAAAWATLAHREWVPAQVWRYGQELNGILFSWRSRADGSGRPECFGRVELLPLEEIYRDWSEELGLKDVPADDRLHHFKPVDLTNQMVYVGLYHDQARDPGLYLYQPGEGEAPYPLHVDLRGYVRLLAQSMGHAYWPFVLLELLPDDGRNPAYQLDPFTPDFRRDLEAWVPDFDYAAFVALYREVQLPGAPPA